MVLVKKKDGSLRFCIDYRRLNEACRKDLYPLPRIDSCMDAMTGACWFSTFDIRTGYHQVKMDPSSAEKTTFITREGTFKFHVMPFGLTGELATFQRLMAALNLEICLVYLDDIVIFASEVHEHLKRLRAIFERLRGARLKLKPSKCKMFQKSVSFLGHVISERGVATDAGKLKIVVTWPVPSCIRDMRLFFGLCSYYRRFVHNFADIAAPLHKMTGKGVLSFIWTPACEIAFEALKTALISSSIMAMPTDDDIYMLNTDASDHSIGEVLSQIQSVEERVIAYESRTYSKAERTIVRHARNC